ncbi:alpha/beta-hydrolase family protein [Gordonia sp. DT218]
MTAAAPPFGPVRYPRRTPFSPPHPAVSIAAALGAVTALWPCGLPRSGIISGALTALCVGIATTAALVVTRRRTANPAPAVAVVAGAAGALVSMALISLSWQNSLRTDLDAPHAGVSWLAASILPAALLFTAIVSLPRTTAMIGATVVAVAAGYLPAAQADDAPSPPRTPAGVIYGLDTGASLTSRSRDLATRWVDAGGLDLRAVVIAVPTGSGWIDSTAVAGYQDRFAGDVAILTIQYAQMPSWRAFVGDRSAAGRSAIALLHEVIDHTMTRPPDRRPQIRLYGQSLGAIGAEEARVWAGDHRPGAVAETLLAGVPGDAVGDGPGSGARRVVLANASDPIPRWSPSLIWRPAQQPRGTVVVGRTVRHPPWLPVVGFLQTSTDLLGSLDGAPGVGHRYGQKQSSSMSSTTGGG